MLTALFVVLAIDAFRARPDLTVGGLALGSSVIALAVAPGSMLLAAMSIFAGCLVIRHRPGRGHRA